MDFIYIYFCVFDVGVFVGSYLVKVSPSTVLAFSPFLGLKFFFLLILGVSLCEYLELFHSLKQAQDHQNRSSYGKVGSYLVKVSPSTLLDF